MEVAEEALDVNEIPIETLDISLDIETSKGLDGLASADKYYLQSLAAEKSKKKQKRYATDDSYIYHLSVDIVQQQHSMLCPWLDI